MPSIGNHVDAVFIPESVNTSTTLRITGGDLIVNTNDLFVDESTNRVGILTSTPGYTLDVNGDINIPAATNLLINGTQISTADLIEDASYLFYTDARSRAAISVTDSGGDGSLSYDSGTGVITYTGPSAAETRAHFSGGTGITLSSGTISIDDTDTNVLGGSLTGSLGDVRMLYSATAPSSPLQGLYYFDSLNQKLKVGTGSTFVDAVPSSGGGGGSSTTDANTTFRKYTYTLTSTTNAVSGSSDAVVADGDFVVGNVYTIKTVGTTDFTALGASANTVGVQFTATGNSDPVGTGDAYDTLYYATGGTQNVEVYVNGVKAVEGSTNDYVATTGTSVTFTANLSSGDVVDIQVYELLTNDAYYVKSDVYTKTETNTQISTALGGYVPITGGSFTGNVGIGTNTPGTRHLQVFDSTGTAFISLKTGTGTIAEYLFGDQADDNIGRIRYDHSDDSMALWTNAAERLRIDSSGNVNIGAKDYNSHHATVDSLQIGYALNLYEDSYTSGTDNYVVLGNNVYYNNGNKYMRNDEASRIMMQAGNFYFQSAAAGTAGNAISFIDVLRITSAGNVGIGTNNPGTKLSVYGGSSIFQSSASGSALIIRDNSIENYNRDNDTSEIAVNYLGYNSTNTYFRDFTVYNGKGSTIAKFIGSTSNVGIGTNNPSVNLDVRGTISTTAGLVNVLRGDITYPRISIFPVGTASDAVGDVLISGYYPIVFKTDLAQERMRISRNGNVGIGTDDPSQKLDVNGNINLSSSGNYIQKTFADNTEEYILRGSSLSLWNPFITYTRSSGTAQRGFILGSHDNNGNRSNWISIWNTNVGIGTATPLSKIDSRGNVLIATNASGNNILSFGNSSSYGPLVGAPDASHGSSFIVGNASTASGAPSHISAWTSNGGIVGERFRITSVGNVGIGTDNPGSKLQVHGNTVINSGHLEVNTPNSSRGYTKYRVATGYKLFGTTSGTWTDIARVGHSHALELTYMVVQNDNYALGGAHGTSLFNTRYGSSSSEQVLHKNIGAMNGGEITGFEWRYLNSGGSYSYILQARVTFTGTTNGAFSMGYSIKGHSSDTIIPL